jgi:hypothetical protein
MLPKPPHVAPILDDRLGPFGRHATSLRAKNFAVMPANGKQPLIGGFGNWRGPPSMETVHQWAQRHSDADIVYLPWKTYIDHKGHWRVLIIDADDAAAVQRIGDIFGATPGLIRTRRGKHFIYRIRAVEVPIIRDLVGAELKKFGINADLKYQEHDIAVCAHSRHEDDRNFTYAWDGCDESVIEDLPPFDVALLAEFARANSKPEPARAIKPTGEFPEGSRGLMLNKLLCAQAGGYTCRDDVLEVARGINDAFSDQGYEPLNDTEVIKRADAVWNDFLKGKLEVRHNRRARASITMDELDGILANGGTDAAIVLLLKLRGEHGGRTLRGEDFANADYAMAHANTLPGWGRTKYRSARDHLLQLDYIERTQEAKGNKLAAQYRLIAQHVGPSLAKRRQQP